MPYPLPDDRVRVHLLDAPSADREVAVKQHLRKFLSSLFIMVIYQSRELFPFPENGMMAYERMARTCYEFFGEQSQRSEFYDQVVLHAEHNSDTDCGKHIDQLTADLKRRCSNWPTQSCPILISLDEVHSLYTPRKNEDKQTVHAPSKETGKNASSLRERGKAISLPTPFMELPFDVDLIANPLFPSRETLESVGSLEFTARFGRPR
jgi:hypothetical protein